MTPYLFAIFYDILMRRPYIIRQLRKENYYEEVFKSMWRSSKTVV